jgi:hypothetical protein
MNEQQLPPLPEPDHSLDCGEQPFYRPDQMQAYARAALAANVPADLCERICAAINAADEKSMDEANYMLDSNDCIAIVRAQFAAAPAPEAELVAVVVERERVWLKRGVQSFMLAYEADTDEERQWYAQQLRTALSSFTPDVKTAPAQAQQAAQGVPAGWHIVESDGKGGIKLWPLTDAQALQLAIEATPAQAQQSSEPLPCPFCGHVGLEFADGSTHRWGLASCAGCGATCGEVRRAYPPDDKWRASAIKDWNTRAKPEAQQAPELERMTAHRVARFLERFLRGKMLGPNEQAALWCVIAQLETKPEAQQPLTDEQIEGGRSKLFSVGNPYCPITEKAMRTAVRWAERAHGIGASGEASK